MGEVTLATAAALGSADPPEGEHLSRRGVAIRVTRRPVPDSTEGSIEIALRYGRGGAGRECFGLEHHQNTKAKLAGVFDLLLNDINPLGVPYPTRSEAQKWAFTTMRSGNKPQSPPPPTLHPFLRFNPQHAEGIRPSSFAGMPA